MKNKVANYSKGLLVVTVFFGLFLAWKESRNPFNFFKQKPIQIENLSNNNDNHTNNVKLIE
jgi:hypothetical protein